jgi:hypothetical protein
MASVPWSKPGGTVEGSPSQGILAEGPAPLIEAYAGVLSRHRLAPAVIAKRGPVRWRVGGWEDLAAPYRLLMVASSYVVAARFTAKCRGR